MSLLKVFFFFLSMKKIKILENNITSFNELCKVEHPHRRLKKWGVDIKELHNFFNK